MKKVTIFIGYVLKIRNTNLKFLFIMNFSTMNTKKCMNRKSGWEIYF